MDEKHSRVTISAAVVATLIALAACSSAQDGDSSKNAGSNLGANHATTGGDSNETQPPAVDQDAGLDATSPLDAGSDATSPLDAGIDPCQLALKTPVPVLHCKVTINSENGLCLPTPKVSYEDNTSLSYDPVLHSEPWIGPDTYTFAPWSFTTQGVTLSKPVDVSDTPYTSCTYFGGQLASDGPRPHGGGNWSATYRNGAFHYHVFAGWSVPMGCQLGDWSVDCTSD